MNAPARHDIKKAEDEIGREISKIETYKAA